MGAPVHRAGPQSPGAFRPVGVTQTVAFHAGKFAGSVVRGNGKKSVTARKRQCMKGGDSDVAMVSRADLRAQGQSLSSLESEYAVWVPDRKVFRASRPQQEK